MSDKDVIDIMARHRCDGKQEYCEDGSYVLLKIVASDGIFYRRISRGVAELLRDELTDILGKGI